MTAASVLASLLDRLAALTSITRTRSEDAGRLELHGGRPDELSERIAAVAQMVGSRVRKLEEAVK